MKELLVKILEVQKKMKGIMKSETNPFMKNKYFNINGLIEELKPVLNEVGLVVLQPLCMDGGKQAVGTLVVDPETSQQLVWSVVLPETTDAQKMGAAITYLRRYSLTSLFLLVGETDDDANSISAVAPATKPPVVWMQKSSSPNTPSKV